MVAYALVRELPALSMVLSGAVVAVVLVTRTPATTLEAVASAVLPIVIAALSRSQPADSWHPRAALEAPARESSRLSP